MRKVNLNLLKAVSLRQRENALSEALSHQVTLRKIKNLVESISEVQGLSRVRLELDDANDEFSDINLSADGDRLILHAYHNGTAIDVEMLLSNLSTEELRDYINRTEKIFAVVECE